MGNINSQEAVYREKRNALKKLYNMDRGQLEQLLQRIQHERGTQPANQGNILTNIDLQRLLINELRNYQSTLLGRVPTGEYNKVDNFLTQMSLQRRRQRRHQRQLQFYLRNRNPLQKTPVNFSNFL